MSKPMFLGSLVGKGAGQCELVNAEGGSVLATHVEPAFDSKARRRGLLGRDSVPDDYALVIAPCSSVHTFFMRFPIDLVLVSKDGRILKTCRSMKPWRIAGALRAFAVIEAAPGFIDRNEIVPGDVVAVREIPHKRRASDVLPPLAATSPRDAGVPKALHADQSNLVTLADIIARKVPLSWFQSVAIVQELCAAVLARGPAGDPRVPELADIALTAVGGVELLADGPAERSQVHRACLVLLALTPEAQLPLQLRLLALGGLAPRAQLKSLKELHAELEFFERPDRLDIVRVVYDRLHVELPPASAEGEQLRTPLELRSPPDVSPSSESSPSLKSPAPKRRRPWSRWKSVGDGLRIVLVTLIVLAAVWQWQRPEGQWMRSGVAAISRAVTVASQKVVQAVEAARDQLSAAVQ